jgi:hypothetical protein
MSANAKHAPGVTGVTGAFGRAHSARIPTDFGNREALP